MGRPAVLITKHHDLGGWDPLVPEGHLQLYPLGYTDRAKKWSGGWPPAQPAPGVPHPFDSPLGFPTPSAPKAGALGAPVRSGLRQNRAGLPSKRERMGVVVGIRKSKS